MKCLQNMNLKYCFNKLELNRNVLISKCSIAQKHENKVRQRALTFIGLLDYLLI